MAARFLHLLEEPQRGNTPAVGGNYAFERGVSSYDIPQSFSASFGYELPFGKGKALLPVRTR